MSPLQARISWGLLAVCCSVGLAMSFTSEPPPRVAAAHELLPAGTVAYLRADGDALHKEAWENTAAYKSMYESGLADLGEQLFEFIGTQLQNAAPGEQAQQFETIIEHLESNGMTVGVSFSEQAGPLPSLTIVFPGAAAFADQLGALAAGAGGSVGVAFEKRDVNGRSVMSTVIPGYQGVEVGFWAEGKHLVIVGGVNAVAEAVAVAAGEAPNLSTNPIWKKYSGAGRDFDSVSVAWLDFASLRQRFGGFPLPTPEPRTVNDLLEAVGLHNMGTLAYEYGYQGPALRTEMTMEVDGPRTGLLAMCGQQPMTMKDLPPLPAGTSGFTAARCDYSRAWTDVMGVIKKVAALGPGDSADQIEGMLANLPQMIGFDPATELIEPLGDITCAFVDSNQGFIGSGIGVAVSVDDAAKLRGTLSRVLGMVTEMSRGGFRVHETEKHGRTMLSFEFDKQVQLGAMVVDDDWFVVGLLPQTVEAFLLRLDGKLPAWKPTAEQAEALAGVPGEFNSISMGDPRVAWSALIKMAPAGFIAAEAWLKESRLIPRDAEFPITLADLPPAELVMAPLFPNVSVGTSDANGLRVTTRQSVPGVPLIGGLGDGNSAVAVGVGVALLLPAIQQARSAARRTQSMNNMKQIGLAMHNYHDVYNSFPSGSVANEKLKPEARLSWMASALPFMDQANLYEQIDFDEGWDSDDNRMAAETVVPNFINPGFGTGEEAGAVTHYAGMAGLGKDAPSLPVTSPRAGIFGDNRKTRMRDIIDGTSNTIMATEVVDGIGPWAQGGKGTYRALTKKPYINGPDGIGGPWPGGCVMLMADGSVRFVSENIDPTTLEHLSTIAGREVISGF